MLKDSYLQAPAEIYFNGDFTISVWVYINSIRVFSRVIDFGNGPYLDNIILSLSRFDSAHPYFEIFYGSTPSLLVAVNALPLKKWTHLLATYASTNASIYINGNFDNYISNVNLKNNLLRTKNYIGKSHFAFDMLSDAFIRKLRI